MKMIEHRVGRLLRRVQVFAHRRVDLGDAILLQLALARLVPQSALLEESAQTQQRFERPGVVDFPQGAIAAGVVRRGVIAQTIGERLDHRRAAAGTCPFQGGADGTQVQSGLLADSKGNLYGMTTYGGTGPCAVTGLPGGCGTVFELAVSGTTYTKSTLYNFQGTDGSLPTGDLYPGPAGRVYGTTPFGGSGTCNDYGITGCGVLFALTPGKNGVTEKVLYNFPACTNKGIYPNDPLVTGTTAYVTTCCGGHNQFGTFDKIKLPPGD